MATYRVPEHAAGHTAHPISAPSVTSAPGGAPGTDSMPGSRRGSASTGGAGGVEMQQQPGQYMQPKVDKPIAASAAVPATNTVVRQRAQEKKGWSRGKKICCGLLLLFIAAIITMGVLIAFLVRVPDVEYAGARVICLNNDYIRCATEEVQIE